MRSFPTLFFATQSRQYSVILAAFSRSSANPFNFDQQKMLSFCIELTTLLKKDLENIMETIDLQMIIIH